MAGIISIIGYVPYIIAIIKRKTRPARSSWIIWSLLSFIILASYKDVGAGPTLFIPIAYTLGAFVTMILALFYGEGGWSKFDRLCILASISSLFVWWLTKSAFLALTINILIDVIGGLPTVKKVYYDPKSENKLAWGLFLVGAIFNVLAIDKLSFTIAFYPLILLGLIGTIFCLIATANWRDFSKTWEVFFYL